MLNLFYKGNWRLEIPDASYDNFIWQVQNVSIPTVDLGITEFVRGPKYAKLGNTNVASTEISYGDLSVTFLLDEDFKTYKEIYKWMLTMNSPIDNGMFEGKIPKTMLLHILDNNKDKVVATYRFLNPFPKSISEVEMNYIETGDLTVSTCDVTFEVSYFTLEIDGKEVKAFS